MVQINFARKEINCKLVYYGPGLSGKTTNLEMVHEKTPETSKGELTSISTDGDRTLFFDFMPLDLGEIAGMKTKFHLYTVPGQVYYNSTRKLVLLGADGVIFVADSTPGKMQENKDSLENLRENLLEAGKDVAKFPLVIQWNKRDIEGAVAIEELERELNPRGAPTFEAVAAKGEGVYQTLKALSSLVLKSINSTKSSSLSSRAAPPTPEKLREAIENEPASDEPPRVTVPSSEDPPPATGGFVLERGEVVTGEKKGASDSAPLPPPPGERPKVASNPLEEVASVSASKNSPATNAGGGAPRANAASGAATAVQTPPVVDEEDELAQRMKKGAVPSKARGSEGFKREVRVIGGRKDGAPPRQSNKNMVTGLVLGAAIMAAGAAIWFLVLS